MVRRGVMRTASGSTSYEYVPGGEGGAIVFIHGFAVPSAVWEENFRFLSERGRSVIRYDRFGRGGSAATARGVPHTMELFGAQLEELLDALDPPRRVSLVGLSFGAAVAASFARARPDMVERVCFIDPALRGALPAAARLVLAPVIGPLLFNASARAVLKVNLGKSIPPGKGDELRETCMRRIGDRDTRDALRSTIVHAMFARGAIEYAGMRPGMPVSLVWGTEDAVIDFAFAEEVRRSLGACDFYPLRGGGHCPPIDRAEDLNEILAEFLGSGASRGRPSRTAEEGA